MARAVSEKPELAPDYYLDNFLFFMRFVLERYDDILTPSERAFADQLLALPREEQKTYVRLVSRKGPWVRLDKFAYTEIQDVQSCLVALSEKGLVSFGGCAALSELLVLLTVPEIKMLAVKSLGVSMQACNRLRREELLALFSEVQLSLSPDALKQELVALVPAARAEQADILRLFRLLFFGNFEQDLTEFVLQDLGLIRYESYPLSKELRLFPTRNALDDRMAVQELEERVAALFAEGNALESFQVTRDFVATKENRYRVLRRRIEKIANEVARDLERAGLLLEALELYSYSNVPPSRERRVRILEKMGRLEEAQMLVTEMLARPFDESERDYSCSYLRRKAKKLSVCLAPEEHLIEPEVKVLTLSHSAGTGVEQQVSTYLARNGFASFFSENWLWLSFFGLAFWDIIFAPVPGVFHHPFQRAPLDMMSREFVEARREIIRARLHHIASSDVFLQDMCKTYEEKNGIANLFVPWDEQLKPLLFAALEVVPREVFVGVMETLLQDLRRFDSGFPDLFVFPAQDQNWQLWEVKGPGDQMRPAQKFWAHRFAELGVHIVVAKVKYE